MSIARDLRIAARRWRAVRAGKPAPTSAGAAEREELRRWAEALKKAAPVSELRSTHVFEIEATQLPWLDTGLDLRQGESVSTFAAGRVVLSEPLDIWVGPQFQAWFRIGEAGTIFNGSRDSNSFRCRQPGRLYLAGAFPGQWGDPSGRVSTLLGDYAKYKGGITVVVLRWRATATEGLRACAGADPAGRIAAEIARLADPPEPPEGWTPLWFLGNSEIFRRSDEGGHACIACHTERNVCILQHDAPFELKPGTKLRWSWKVDELPSTMAEDTMASHDYLSVAVEFENGRDITYTWSPELAAGTGYWCPLPTWKDREFHVVVRSGSGDLGKWLDEERDLHADYAKYMGTPPKRVVRVWLIAVSLFQRGTGRACFRSFVLEGEGGKKLAFD